MQELVFRFNKSDQEVLGNIRCIEGLLVASSDDDIWLRGIYDSPTLDLKIKQLPARQSFYINENDLLFAPGSLTPVDKLPLLSWQPLAEFLPIQIPVAAMPGQMSTLATIKLVTTQLTKAGEALLTSLQIWKAYAESAPGTRLAKLKFAVAQNNDVLIMGNPLPPLPGKEYWLEKNILLPNGYRFEIYMTADFINEQFNPQQDSVLIFDSDGTWQKIDNSFFVPAKRSAIRLTKLNESF